MINGIKPRVSTSDFDAALNRLVMAIHEDFKNSEFELKRAKITIKPGRKFIKIVRENSVWGFIVKEDGTHKGVPVKRGDVLKAAGWNAPAKHTRGNIFDSNQNYFRWTGPNYL